MAGSGPRAEAPNSALNELPPPEEPLSLTVVIGTEGYIVRARGEPMKRIDRTDTGYDTERLSQWLTELRARYGDEASDVRVTSEDGVPYQGLITVMDICLDRGLDEISVGGADA